jgi:glycosyltransferase involved in cell wall biosynthesis
MRRPVLVVLPAWNEAANVEAVIGELRAARPDDEIVAVDDGSTDDTASVARRLCRVLRLPLHLGYGTAVQTGIRYGLAHRHPVVVTFDADGQHDPADVAPLVAAVLSGVDLAIGSRAASSGAHHGSVVRRTGRAVFSAMVRLLAGLRLGDPTSGLKALGPRAQALFAQARFPDRYPDADALVLARRARLSIEERPARMRPSRNRHSMHDGTALAYTANMLLSLMVAALSREDDLRR